MIEQIEALQEKLQAKKAALEDAYKYVSFSEMQQFKAFHFAAMELALWLIVEDLSSKRPAGKKIKTYSEWSDKDIQTIFYPACSKDDLREGLQGVYFDNNFVVATDAHVLLMFADKSKNQRSGNYRFNKIAKEPTLDVLIRTESKFPDYMNILPRTQPKLQREINLSDFYAFLNQFPKYTKIARKNRVDFITFYSGVKIFDGFYNIEFLLKITKALLQVGETSARFDFWEKDRAAIVNGTENMALIAPLYQNPDETISSSYPIKY